MGNTLRFCLFATILFFLQCGTSLNAQNQYAFTSAKTYNAKVDYAPNQDQKQKLLSVLKELNRVKGVYFLYSEESIGNQMVNPVKDVQDRIEKILDNVLDNSGLKYKKVSTNTFVILKEKQKIKSISQFKPMLGSDDNVSEKSLQEMFQLITGRVITGDNKPLAGVSVHIKGTNVGTTTNEDGAFSIEANRGDVLVFSYVGYQAKEVIVSDNSSLNVSLSAIDQQMSEVVVTTALGIKKQQRQLGYAVSKVPGQELTQAREINLGNALEGRVAGVNSSGPLTGPGGSSNVLIRGNVTLNGIAQPLYVINGVPFRYEQNGQAGMYGGADLGDAMSSINPDDIEDITVLKGASAAALYGQLASNGVILITTKSGKARKGIGIEVNSNVQIDKINNFLDFQNVYGQGTLGAKPTDSTSAQNTGLSSWGAKLDGSPVILFDGKTHPYSDQGDNMNRFYQTGATFSNTVAFSGGSDAINYRMSLGDLRSSSVYPNSKYNRNTLDLDLNYKLSPMWSGQTSILYSKEIGTNRPNLSDAPGNGNYAIAFLPPNVNADYLKPGYDANGNEIRFSSDAFTTNPFFAAAKFINNTTKDRIFGVTSLRFTPVNWIYVQGRLTNDFSAFNATQITPTGTAYRPTGSIDNESMALANTFNADVLAGASKKFLGGRFGADLTLGANYLRDKGRADAINASGLAFPFLYNPAAATTRNASVNSPEREVHSVYGSLELSYNNTLFVNVTDRNDWSSTLPMNNNSYNYPSVNASYIFTENLKIPWLSYGKLRAGIAQIGHDANIFSTLLYYSTNGSINGQPIGSIGPNIPNAELEPTKIKEYEVGTELAMFKNIVTLNVSLYKKQTLNDIVQSTVSSTSGYTSAVLNIGQIENKGIEIELGATLLNTKSFRWRSNFNYAYNKNTVVALAEGQQFMSVSESRTTVGFIQHFIGLPAYQVTVNDFKRDASGNLVLSASGFPQPSDNLKPVGTGIPPTTGGWSNDFSYKNFRLSVLIDYKFGGVIYSGTNARAYGYGLQKATLAGRDAGITLNGVDDAGNKVTKTITAQDYYGTLATIGIVNVYKSDFIKLRSASLTYSIPASFFHSKIQGINISLVARNLFYFKRSTPNIDPEANYSQIPGLEYASLPSTKSYGLNLNFKF